MEPRRIELEAGGFAIGDGNLVMLAGETLVDGRIDVSVPGIGDRPDLRLTIDSTSGAPRCVHAELSVKPDGGRPVRRRDLREVEVDAWIEAITPLFATIEIVGWDEGGFRAVVHDPDAQAARYREARKAMRGLRRADRRRLTPDVLERVAEVYRAPHGGADAIVAAFGVSESTAFRYVRRAREAGYLEPREP